MVAIPINQRVQNAVLKISGLSISITNYGVPYRYLGIFLLTDGLSKLSLAKAQSDVKFFSKIILRKAILDKQFMYLVLAVFQPIDGLIKKGFKTKAGLSQDFPNEVLYHSLLYGLKTFEQIQAEGKSASVMSFSNSSGIVGRLFEHHFLDLQILDWAFLNPLQFSVRLHVVLSNNFLAGIVCILLINKISMMNNLPSAFLSPDKYPVSGVLGPFLYYDQVSSLKKFGVAFCDRLLDKQSRKLDSRGPVPSWFILVSRFLHDKIFLSTPPVSNFLVDVNNVLLLDQFFVVKNSLLEIWSSSLSVFTDGSLKGFGSVDVTEGVAAFFFEIGLDFGVRVVDLLSSTMAELQAIALALKCVLFSCSVKVCLDSQAALDACVSDLRSGGSDFHDCCWIERRHIANLIVQKNISVS
ncbi:hypothetical protein G9A89_003462 [Geosiphon pyriformis]|nr:hypothetical protein G9A89_003462 [Geosiphon pyriformis]